MNYNPNEICYLCGHQLGNAEINSDHIFQQQFIARVQPIVKGFDYGGVLPVHKACNKSFGTGTDAPESICRKSLQLLEVLHSKNTLVNDKSKIMAINSSLLPEFTEKDVRFFKFINVQNVPLDVLVSDQFLADKIRVNPFVIPTNVALSTLAKSAAGFLVKRYGYPRQGNWRILGIPHMGQNEQFDLDDLFGGTKPLEVGIKLWIKPEDRGWFLAYKQKRLLVFLAFESEASDLFSKATKSFHNANCLFYDSNSLIGLVGYNWSANKYPL